MAAEDPNDPDSWGPRPTFNALEKELTLTHSPPIWTLPASSARCLEAMLYLRMCKIPFSKNASSYHKSAKGDLPHLYKFRHDHGADSYMDFLKENEERGNLDADLSTSERILAHALSSHVRQTLSVITNYMLWVEPENRGHAARAFGATFPLLIRQLLLRRRRKHAEDLCQAQGYKDADKVQKELKLILKDLSEQLGDKMYFFGNKCSSLDAVVGGQLLFLFYSGVPVNYVESLDIDIQNLKDFVYRLLSYDMQDEDFEPSSPCSFGCVDSGFLRDFFLESSPISVDDYWVSQQTKREAEAEGLSDEEREKTESESKSLINFDEHAKSWLFLGATVATVVFYIGWYKNIRGIRIEIQ